MEPGVLNIAAVQRFNPFQGFLRVSTRGITVERGNCRRVLIPSRDFLGFLQYAAGDVGPLQHCFNPFQGFLRVSTQLLLLEEVSKHVLIPSRDFLGFLLSGSLNSSARSSVLIPSRDFLGFLRAMW